jgi:nucleotide-binding universal stress UspA family protein
MIGRILLAVDDSAPSIAATRVAVALAAALGARLRAVTVVAGEVPPGPGPGSDRGRADSSAAVLRHVGRAAARSGIAAEGVALTGRPAMVILDQAAAWSADLIVVGRSARRGPAAHLGSQALQLLEFAEVPVLVVPYARARVP